MAGLYAAVIQGRRLDTISRSLRSQLVSELAVALHKFEGGRVQASSMGSSNDWYARQLAGACYLPAQKCRLAVRRSFSEFEDIARVEMLRFAASRPKPSRVNWHSTDRILMVVAGPKQKNARVLLLAAETYQEIGESRQAANLFKRAVALAQGDIPLELKAIVRLLSRARQRGKATRELFWAHRAYAIAPEQADTVFDLGVADGDAGMWRKALARMQQVLRLARPGSATFQMAQQAVKMADANIAHSH